MVKSFRRIFGIVKRHRFRFFLSQFMMFIAALATVGYATLIAPLVNEGSSLTNRFMDAGAGPGDGHIHGHRSLAGSLFLSGSGLRGAQFLV